MLNGNDTTALVIEHKIKKGSEKRYEKWLAEILELTGKFGGYLGREIFPPAAPNEPYIVIVRFQTESDLRTWLDSTERKAAIEPISGEFEDGDKTEVRAGIDVWFAPKNAAGKPRPYKQFLLTSAAIYPLSLIVPQLLSPLFETMPFLKNPLLAGLIVTFVLVGLMTYLVMPFLTDWLRGWLYAPAAQRHK